jgi:hypothetical protein
MRVIKEEDLVTPDMSQIQKIGDLDRVGLKNVLEMKVKNVYIQNGQLRLVVLQHELGKNLSNQAVTRSMLETMTPFRQHKGHWSPPNCTWGTTCDLSRSVLRKQMMQLAIQTCMRGSGSPDMGMAMGMHTGMGMGMGMGMEMQTPMKGMENSMVEGVARGMNRNEPVQGAVANSWLIAALFAVAWAEPSKIMRDESLILDEPEGTEMSKKRHLSIKLHSKGGENDAPTSDIKVSYDIPVNNMTNTPVYCRSSHVLGPVWPSLYEKAFAKWLLQDNSDHPDITRTSAAHAGGDPIKAMAQINNREPHYYFTQSRRGPDLFGIVRAHCVGFKTIQPMCAYTYASGEMYKGCNIVANHAYTILGWTPAQGDGRYVVLRNPWGVTETRGMTTYAGMLDVVNTSVWPPADTVDLRGVFALEAESLKHYFACIGIAK